MALAGQLFENFRVEQLRLEHRGAGKQWGEVNQVPILIGIRLDQNHPSRWIGCFRDHPFVDSLHASNAR